MARRGGGEGGGMGRGEGGGSLREERGGLNMVRLATSLHTLFTLYTRFSWIE